MKLDILYGYQTIRANEHYRIVPPTPEEIRRQRWHDWRVRYLDPAVDAFWFALAFTLLKLAIGL